MDFALILFVCTVVTGVLWALDKRLWEPKRRAAADEAVREFDVANREAVALKNKAVLDERSALWRNKSQMPWYLEYTASLFPAFAIVFLIRSFLFEPFRIPSGSMLPTLHIGDFILVNKYQYGIRLPVVDLKVVPVGSPQRGDVVVFRYPMDTSVNYIKRVVGLPGDTVEVKSGVLSVNGVTYDESYLTDERTARFDKSSSDFSITLGEDEYFVMGDNRDNSNDSRNVGVINRDMFVGKVRQIIWPLTRFSTIGGSEVYNQ